MRSLTSLLTSIIFAVWTAAIAIFSVQNVFVTDAQGQPRSIALKFFTVESIRMPLGVILALSFATGILGTAIAQPLFSGSQSTDDDE